VGYLRCHYATFAEVAIVNTVQGHAGAEGRIRRNRWPGETRYNNTLRGLDSLSIVPKPA
jgi:hypothetical protein